ncbi:MAG: DUF2150 family protein [Methanocalculaceae archaeon]|jgi:hypothetical protein|nr:DUF2150 family protein [Methanocalculaceae archaeon]
MVAKKSFKKVTDPQVPAKLYYIFYNQERWNNWLNALAEADFSGDEDSDEMPEGYRILDEFSDDITLAVLKIIRLYQNDRITLEEARTKSHGVEEIIMEEPPDSDIADIVRSMQDSMIVLFAAGQKYLEGAYPPKEEIKNLVKEGRSVFLKDPEKAFDMASSIGAAVINGASCCGKYITDADDPTQFDEWLAEIERAADAMKSLKNFDEVVGDAQ